MIFDVQLFCLEMIPTVNKLLLSMQLLDVCSKNYMYIPYLAIEHAMHVILVCICGFLNTHQVAT